MPQSGARSGNKSGPVALGPQALITRLLLSYYGTGTFEYRKLPRVLIKLGFYELLLILTPHIGPPHTCERSTFSPLHDTHSRRRLEQRSNHSCIVSFVQTNLTSFFNAFLCETKVCYSKTKRRKSFTSKI